MHAPLRSLAALVGMLLALTSAPAAATDRTADGPAVEPVTRSGRPAPERVLERRLERSLRAIVRAGAVGAVARVQGPGRSWALSAGDASVRPRRPAVPTAHFRAASVTKQLTSVLALQLVERGTWSLGTTIGDVLPGLWPDRADVTLRQLLSHTSGMPDFVPVLLKRATSTPRFVRAISRHRTDRELVRAAQKRDWLFEPGTDIRYSNTNFIVVGMMLKKQTGRPMGTLLRRRVLEPAGMTGSRLATDRRLPGPALREYALIGRERVDLRRFHPSMFSSAGALVTTARDLNRFHRVLSRGALVSPALVRVMRSVIGHDPEAGVAYGLGSYRYADPCRDGGVVHGHDGATWGTLTLSFTSPDGRRRVTVAMTGRELTRHPATEQAFYGFLDRALAATCGRLPKAGGAGHVPVPRLHSESLRLGSQT